MSNCDAESTEEARVLLLDETLFWLSSLIPLFYGAALELFFCIELIHPADIFKSCFIFYDRSEKRFFEINFYDAQCLVLCLLLLINLFIWLTDIVCLVQE